MRTGTRRALGWGLRALGLALLVGVVATQVHWHDRLVLADGTTLKGAVTPVEGGFRVGGDDGARTVATEDVATRTYGERSVPHVTKGLGSLVDRLRRSPGSVALVLLVLVALIALTAWRWWDLMRAADVRMPLVEALRLGFVGAFFNIAVPGSTGGDVVKAWYAARRTGAATRAVLSVFVDRVVGLLGLALFAAGALWAVPPREGYGPARVVAAAVLIGGFVLGTMLLSRRVRSRIGVAALVRRLPFRRVLAEADAGLRLYARHRAVLALTIFVSLFNHGGTAVAAWLLARALGIEGIDLGVALALVPVANLLSAVPLLPGGWGVGELAFAYFFGQVGVPPTEAVALSVVFRLSLTAASLPGGVLWLFLRGTPSGRRIREEIEAVERDMGDGERSPNGPMVETA